MFDLSTLLATLMLAVLIDMRWGEPPTPIHPVVWMGRYLHWAAQRTPFQHIEPRTLYKQGAAYWLLGAIGTVIICFGATHLIHQLPWAMQSIPLALLLKPSFSWRLLQQEVLAVENALRHSLDAGRQQIATLCSRDTQTLSPAQIRATAIETLAENLNDSFIAPLFWFLLLGLPGAMLYRFANTADAMWGYIGIRNGKDWTWFGRWAARTDDALSYIPARLTALLLWTQAPRYTYQHLQKEALKTPSPNGGWPMAGMALALNIQLEKPHVYCLNPQGQTPEKKHIDQAIQLATQCVRTLMLLASFSFVLSLTSW